MNNNSSTSPSRPDASEFAEYYGKYIATVAGDDVLASLTKQAAALDPLRALSDADALRRYEPDKWSVKEVVGHVTDAERIFACRMLRIARGDATPLPGFDQQVYVESAGFDARPINALVDAFRTQRAATLSIADEIGADEWRRMGTASGFPVSARALAFIVAGHAAHHVSLLRDRYGIAV
ncbi:MAG: DinB family protein [Gemmatimonadaceae bacterium]